MSHQYKFKPDIRNRRNLFCCQDCSRMIAIYWGHDEDPKRVVIDPGQEVGHVGGSKLLKMVPLDEAQQPGEDLKKLFGIP